MDTITKILMAFVVVVPSAVTAFCFWLIEKKIERRSNKEDKERARRQEEVDKKEAARQKNELLTAQAIGAAIALGEATARAVQRIPDAHCNGDMDAALNYAAQVKHAQKDFLYGQAVGNLYAERGA
jgi:hypothetical protein